jgi:hypothetical protein
VFKVHLPYRSWYPEQIVEVETITDINELMWKILPDLIPGEHIIIEETLRHGGNHEKHRQNRPCSKN